MVEDVVQGDPGTRCVCKDRKGVECVVDRRRRCRPLLFITADDEVMEQESQRTAVMEVMRWIRMKDTERRLKELNF